ncbi:class I SAM-dependent methyltransferase [Candidatus Frankia alpina]|uniref:class I SAM-dependent methyltransferase n=1 Tax=Candidatus Frankia alpina TaxID=2699483 RepID=UPI001F2AA971|nr:class I SAM-dependent methyltransferase [Candidatus Frankia alpina]
MAPLGGTGLDPAAYGEHIADVYDEWYAAPGRQPEVAVAVDFLRTRVGAGPALELGVGTGRLALPLAARGTAVVGIDASPRMVARLRDKPGGSGVEVVVDDFADVDAPGGPFGLVYVVFSTFFALVDQGHAGALFRERGGCPAAGWCGHLSGRHPVCLAERAGSDGPTRRPGTRRAVGGMEWRTLHLDQPGPAHVSVWRRLHP